MALSKTLQSKIKRIKVLALDVDGVMTDGKLIFDGDAKELKSFDVQDGFGIVLLRRSGIKTAIITAGNSEVVRVRAEYLNIDQLYSGVYPKITAYEKMLKTFEVQDDQVCFIGDDLTDYQILQRVGFPVTVPNAVKEIKKIACYVTKKQGGHGAVREIVEIILKIQGLWNTVISQDLR